MDGWMICFAQTESCVSVQLLARHRARQPVI